MLCCWCRLDPPLIVSFILLVVQGCFLSVLVFNASRLGFILFLSQYDTRLFLVEWGGNTAGRGLSQVGPIIGFVMLWESSCVSYSFLFTVGNWVIERPGNRSVGGLFEVLPFRFLRFLLLALPTIHSTQ